MSVAVPVCPGATAETPPSRCAHGGGPLPPSAFSTSWTPWPGSSRANWASCGCLPVFCSATLTRPPLVDAGAVKLARLPFSAMLSDSGGCGLVVVVLGDFFLLLPHAATARAATTMNAIVSIGRRRIGAAPYRGRARSVMSVRLGADLERRRDELLRLDERIRRVEQDHADP